MKSKIIIKSFTIVLLIFSIGIIPNIDTFAYGKTVKGDVNADGILSVADAVLLEKWLLGVSDIAIEDWKAADLCEDSKLDVFDFCVMRKELLNNSEKQTIEHIAYPLCKSAALYCIDDNNLIYSDNIDLCIAPASLTKLLTASVALNYLSPDTIVTVGSELSLVKPYSSLCLIAKGHRLRLSDLLTGMLMASGNDAAYTVAVTTARAVYSDEYLTDIQAVERFSGLMNDFASKIGMQNSHFTTPEGWDDANQYTTVKDLLTLSEYALSIPVIRDIVGTYQKYIVFVSGENVTWTNTNNILNPNSPYYIPYALGMKTGTTADAGNCHIGSYTINEKTYISVVVGCETNADRYNLTLKLISELEELL